jgi:hypothetical protein
MSVHAATLMLHFRGYPDGVDVEKPLYQMREKYLYHCIALINDEGEARLEGFEGVQCLPEGTKLNQFKQILKQCGRHGARLVTYRHNGIAHSHNLERRGWTTTHT